MLPFLTARHPDYLADFSSWSKWRQVARGGDSFVRAYLLRQPGEKAIAFTARCTMSPAISYVQMSLNEIIAAFLARLPSVTRTNENKESSYISACNGLNGGVDGFGSSMNQFMAMTVLRELLTVRRVGIFIDRPILDIYASIDEVRKAPPYIYPVLTEDILAWTMRPGKLTPSELLLREREAITAEGSSLVVGYRERYRHMVALRDSVVVRLYDDTGILTAESVIEIPEIPFVLLEISGPAVADVASTQIALLNVESSNVCFALDSNMTVYTEQSDLTTLLAALRRATPTNDSDTDDGSDGATLSDEDDDEPGTESDIQTIRLGRNRGRRYLSGQDRPDFVGPDNNNLSRSIALCAQLKEDIRRVMMLAIANVTTKAITSATALIQGQVTANNGLALLGSLLEKAERSIATLWGYFENDKTITTITYPVDFQILTDSERRDAITELTKLRDAVPSRTFQQVITQQIAQLLLSNTAPTSLLHTINAEITEAPCYVSKVADVVAVVDASIMPRQYAARALCLPEDAAKLANDEHAERLRRMNLAQSTAAGTARGNTDGNDDAASEKQLTQDPDVSSSGSRAVRK